MLLACRLHTLPAETASNCFISREIFYTNWEVNYGGGGRGVVVGERSVPSGSLSLR